MPQIALGFVQDVLNKGEGDKAYAVVGIAIDKPTRSGFKETHVMEFTVRGDQYKAGLHNAYRQFKGVEVFAPYTDEIDTYYKDNPRIRYILSGVPLRYQEAAPKPAAAAQQQPAAAPAAKTA